MLVILAIRQFIVSNASFILIPIFRVLDLVLTSFFILALIKNSNLVEDYHLVALASFMQFIVGYLDYYNKQHNSKYSVEFFTLILLGCFSINYFATKTEIFNYLKFYTIVKTYSKLVISYYMSDVVKISTPACYIIISYMFITLKNYEILDYFLMFISIVYAFRIIDRFTIKDLKSFILDYPLFYVLKPLLNIFSKFAYIYFRKGINNIDTINKLTCSIVSTDIIIEVVNVFKIVENQKINFIVRFLLNSSFFYFFYLKYGITIAIITFLSTLSSLIINIYTDSMELYRKYNYYNSVCLIVNFLLVCFVSKYIPICIYSMFGLQRILMLFSNLLYYFVFIKSQKTK